MLAISGRPRRLRVGCLARVRAPSGPTRGHSTPHTHVTFSFRWIASWKRVPPSGPGSECLIPKTCLKTSQKT